MRAPDLLEPLPKTSFLLIISYISPFPLLTKRNIGHILCFRPSKAQFRSSNFSTISKEYLPRDQDIRCMVAEMEEKLSNSNSLDNTPSVCNRAGKFIPNPNDHSKVLQIEGVILPQNNSILLLTVVVDTLQR